MTLQQDLTSGTGLDAVPEAAPDLVDAIGHAIDAVACAGGFDCGRRRAQVLVLVHRWVAQQDRCDVTHTVRCLDAWAAALNRASRASGSAGPVVRVGLRLRAA